MSEDSPPAPQPVLPYRPAGVKPLPEQATWRVHPLGGQGQVIVDGIDGTAIWVRKGHRVPYAFALIWLIALFLSLTAVPIGVLFRLGPLAAIGLITFGLEMATLPFITRRPPKGRFRPFSPATPFALTPPDAAGWRAVLDETTQTNSPSLGKLRRHAEPGWSDERQLSIRNAPVWQLESHFGDRFRMPESRTKSGIISGLVENLQTGQIIARLQEERAGHSLLLLADVSNTIDPRLLVALLALVAEGN